jgi:sulfide:quinone oxidoreductase
MKVNHLTPDMAVSSQITANDIMALKEAGFRTIICNRPNGESTNQPLFAEIEIVAKRAGMGVFYLPVAPGRPSVEQTRQFGALLASQPAPVLAYCRSGMRSASMWALAQKDRLPPADIVGMAKEAGYDLTFHHRGKAGW